MSSFRRPSIRIKNIIHTLASVSFVIWLIGFFGFQIGGWLFAFLGFSVITTVWLLMAKETIKRDHSESPLK